MSLIDHRVTKPKPRRDTALMSRLIKRQRAQIRAMQNAGDALLRALIELRRERDTLKDECERLRRERDVTRGFRSPDF